MTGPAARPDDGVRIVDVVGTADPAATLAVVTGWYTELWGDRYPAEELTVDLAELAAPGPPTVLVALDTDGTPVGTVAIDPDDVPARRDLAPWLASLVVRPDRRRSGIGARLVAAVCARAAADGIDRLHLMTYDEDGLGDWYHRLGWEVVDRGEHAGRPMTLFGRATRATSVPGRA